ncbi:hypothetical protein [Cupriavidus sp. TMH.W2]|uniref:hypothetical protein n=1 Tax=Cupriavidus sp. TMH.W2 TaxID=3434465 RepID=UPI003D7838BF
MIDLIQAVQSVFDKGARADLQRWLAPLPRGAFWHVISDYVFEDPKKNDTAAFVLLLHHDQLDTILDYLQHIAPKDIKETRAPAEGMLRYLNSPVVFTVSFVLDDDSRFLQPFARLEDMVAQLEEFETIADHMAALSGDAQQAYFVAVRKRLTAFARDLRQKGNQKLARKMFLVAAFAALLLDYLDQVAEPKAIGWTSDRDAMLERHDGIVWDIASLMFYAMKSSRAAPGTTTVDRPQLIHVTQSPTGDNHLDPLIRMADYMAGTVADMDLAGWGFTHPKFEAVAQACLLDAPNHVVLSVAWVGDGFRVRRLAVRSDPSADAPVV